MHQTIEGGQPGSINVYLCPMGPGRTWVRHVDAGVTPAFLQCRAINCCSGNGQAMSRFYPRDIPDDVVGEFEWWRPRTEADARLAAADAIDDAIKRRQQRTFPSQAPLPAEREAAIQGMVQHWRQGGAFLRKSAQPWAAIEIDGGGVRTGAVE